MKPFGLFAIILWIAFAIGWVMNIVQIVALVNFPITGLLILKCVGILVAPLGGILGWIG